MQFGLRGILDKFFKRESTATTSSSSASARTITIAGSSHVYGTTPMSVATVYRCVSLLADSVASLRMQHLTSRRGVLTEIPTDPINYLLSVQPQPERSIFDFWHHAIQQILLSGNAYIYPRIIDGQLFDLVLIDNGRVSHDTYNSTYTITDPNNGVCGTYGEEEVIHLFLHSTDGRRGESVLSHASRTVGIASVGDTETANRFANGGSVRGIISNDRSASGLITGEYQNSELQSTAEDIDTKFQRGAKIISLPGDVGFKQISLSSTDMQFLESRKFTVTEICRFFGVHPSFVFADSGSNYKSAEMASVAFLSMTLDPILKRIEAEFNRKLVHRTNFGKETYRFDRRGIYSLDLTTLADYQKKTIETGIYTINDWRRIENQPTVEGGDTVYISTNLAALGSQKLGNEDNNSAL